MLCHYGKRSLGHEQAQKKASERKGLKGREGRKGRRKKPGGEEA